MQTRHFLMELKDGVIIVVVERWVRAGWWRIGGRRRRGVVVEGAVFHRICTVIIVIVALVLQALLLGRLSYLLHDHGLLARRCSALWNGRHHLDGRLRLSRART